MDSQSPNRDSNPVQPKYGEVLSITRSEKLINTPKDQTLTYFLCLEQYLVNVRPVCSVEVISHVLFARTRCERSSSDSVDGGKFLCRLSDY